MVRRSGGLLGGRVLHHLIGDDELDALVGEVPGGGVTVVYANSEAAIPKAMNVPMYDHSLVIFRNGRPVVRHDFEKPRIVSVERS